MASVKLKLNESRMRKDGTYALVFQIICHRQKRLIYTDYKLRTENFDSVNGKVQCDGKYLPSQKKVVEMNRNLKKQYKKICARIEELSREEKEFSVNDIVMGLREEFESTYLLGFFDECIKLKQDLGKDGTTLAYKSTKASLRTFLDEKDISLARINQRFVESYSLFLSKRKVCDNTVKYYMRNFSAVYNSAVQKGCCKNRQPFIHFRMAPSKTVKRALNGDNMRQLYLLKLPRSSKSEKYRDMFLFSFFAQGMAFVDIVTLKKDNICDGVISYSRYKSQQRVQVKVTDQIQLLLNKYKNNSDYIFNAIDTSSDKSEYEQYRIALAESNRCLKKIGIMLGFNAPLTTYVARHTWAMEAKKSGAPLFVISEGLGHKSEKTTLIYLKELDVSVLDIVNRKVSSVVLTK